jgi:hypothetical protein
MEHGVRSTKLKLIYKKAIQISLNHKNEITKLIQETTPLDSFYTSDTSKSIILKEDLSTTVSQKLNLLQNELSGLFKSKLEEYELIPKLNQLDSLIANGRSTSRDINDVEYIREIFDSYISEDKSSLLDFVQDEILKIKNSEEESQKELTVLKEENKRIEEENRQLESKFEGLSSNILTILEK